MTTGAFSRRTWAVLVFGLAAAVIVQMLVASGVGGESTAVAISDIGGILVIGMAAVVTIRTALAFGTGEPLRAQWLAIGVGIAVYVLGDIVWAYTEVVRGLDPPFPGLPDIFYVAMYVFLGWGIISAALAYKGLVRMKVPLISSAVITIASAAAIYVVLVKDIILDPSVAFLEKALTVFYPAGDTLLLLAPAVFIVLVVSQLGRGALGVPWRFVVAGVAVLAVADAVYQWLEWQGAYSTGHIIDLGWMIGYVLLAVGASVMRDLILPAPRG
ncbi:MAG: hypothetical protein D9V44_01760 [Actinobacteria bacterium]|nr:MAG: hypothetical protein D9V44_01760 [Actinomycetota bacterium]